MSQVGEIIRDAMLLIGVIDANEAPDPEDYKDAIRRLNAMCRRWEANGMAIGWQPVENPSDTLPVPEEVEECVTYNLAVKLAPMYQVTTSAEVAMQANMSLMEVRRDRAVEMPLVQTAVVPIGSGFGRYNVYTDSNN